MSLAPESRVMLTDALRPPAEFRVDAAVGTTYTLDLTALLLAPLAFAVADRAHTTGGDDSGIDPIRLLEAVRRHADRTTIFVQAGGIAVPSNYRSMLTFIEDSVREVAPPAHARIFHPKIWALRFIDAAGGYQHRVVILSRNLTFDRSWDTALVLDESPDGTIDAEPAASFIRELPSLGLRALDSDRQALIDDLSTTLAAVRLQPPTPFTEGRLLPIGLTDQPVWPFPARADRLLAISPFLTPPAVAGMARISGERTLVSRAESFDLIGSTALDGWSIRTLQRLAEGASDADTAIEATRAPHDGLHAKTFVLDLDGGTSTTVTGSANMTSAQWGKSVEFDAVLTGPTHDCGVERVLDDDGLAAVLGAYTPQSESGAEAPTIATEKLIEQFQLALAASHPVLQVDAATDGLVTLTLVIDPPPDPGMSRVWPASVSATQARPSSDPLVWTIAAKNVTPFLAVETTAGQGESRVTTRCVIMAELTGDVGDRRAAALHDVLSSPLDVLRYLVFLLGDPSYDDLVAASATAAVGYGEFGPAASTSVTLFEPLVRALGRDTDALARVANLVDELRAMPNGAALIPESFDELWDAVWRVHQEVSA
ncbi:phospholipase D family protein [Microbacterium kribbense]|uniref:Phospholipase D family protein n=1 Tax=Microbacterium kribbense TaxID=433645 RepID=A0ABP7G873_9MICO